MQFNRYFFAVLLVFFFAASSIQAAPITTNVNQKVFDAVLYLDSVQDFDGLKDLFLTVTGRTGSDYILMASEEEIAVLRQLGYRVDVLGRNDLPKSQDGYHGYSDSITELQGIVSANPDIAALSTVATSWQGREVVALKISDNVELSEAEPALLYDHTIHGDESIATEVAFGFIHELIDNYGVDPTVTLLVDENEFFIVPFVNPDGLVNDTRGNGHGVDMNRNYPFWWEGWSQWSPEPETVGMMDLSLSENFMFSISYHSGSEVINYCWDGIYTLSPDNDLERSMSLVYDAKSNYGITNGAAWYIADGTSEDWYHGSVGTISVIVEISNVKEPTASQIPYYVDKNVPSMIDWALESDKGVRGLVTSTASGQAVEALVIADDRLAVTTDPVIGDYYRPLFAGGHWLHVWANGYGWTDLTITVPSTGHLVQDFELTPQADAIYAAMRCVVNIRKDPPGDDPPNKTLPVSALGGADGEAFSLGKGGYAVFDMGSTTPVADAPGPELTVVENGDDEGYSVEVAQYWNGPWLSLGGGFGTTDFDVAASGLTEIRYVKIIDDGDGTNYEPTPGVDIDAIEASPLCEIPVSDFLTDLTTGPAPLTVQFFPQIEADPGCLTGVEWGFGDGTTSVENLPIHVYENPGTYTVSLTAVGPAGQDTETKEDFIQVTGPGDDDDDTGDDDTGDDDAGDDDDDDSGGCFF